jgi:hypothetical protein
MKHLPLILWIVGVTILFAAVLGPYFYNVSSHFSLESKEWANFGSYFGGVLSPIVASLALLGLGVTISQQSKQFKGLTKQLKLTQLENTIRNIENDFTRCLSGNTFSFSDQTYSYEDLLMHVAISSGEKAIPPFESLTKDRESLDENQIILISTIATAAGHLNQLRLYVNKHYEVSGTNVISKYYERKYTNAVTKLISLGYLDQEKVWNCT